MSVLSPANPAGGLAGGLPPTKILTRRPTLVRKRDEDDEDRTPSSPGKRQRVTFDSDVEVRTVPNTHDAPEIIQEEVRQAFEKRKWGDNTEYERLIAIFMPDDDGDQESPEVIKKHTVALLSHVAQLNKDTAGFVRALLNSKWLGMSDEYVSLYVRLLANILASQGMFMIETLRMLTSNLTLTQRSNVALGNLPIVSRSAAYTRVHKALQYLLQVLPSSAKTLSSALSSSFPNHRSSTRNHITYIKNLLRILDYAPQLRGFTLNSITEKLVKIDVQVQVELEDLTDEAGQHIEDKIPQIRPGLLDDMDESDDSESESDSEDEEDEELRKIREIQKNVEKMDLIMDVLFTFYSTSFSQGSSHSENVVVETLLSQFTSTILPTYRSRHTQFLLFHFVQQSTNFIDTFVGACVQTIFDQKQSAIIRQSAAATLASFVARGRHVPGHVVRDVFDFLGSELEQIRKVSDNTCRGPDLQRYSMYYCLVQAMLYIFCFRWKDLQIRSGDDEDETYGSGPTRYGALHRWQPGVKEALSTNVFSKMNPLKVCSPGIVNEFARIANHLSIVYVYHLLETNKRLQMSHIAKQADLSFRYGQPSRETALSLSKDEAHLHLDEYFPFDPYHLPRSKHWIEGDYRDWEGIPGLDDEESDSVKDEKEEGDMEEGTETDHTGRLA